MADARKSDPKPAAAARSSLPHMAPPESPQNCPVPARQEAAISQQAPSGSRLAWTKGQFTQIQAFPCRHGRTLVSTAVSYVPQRRQAGSIIPLRKCGRILSAGAAFRSRHPGRPTRAQNRSRRCCARDVERIYLRGHGPSILQSSLACRACRLRGRSTASEPDEGCRRVERHARAQSPSRCVCWRRSSGVRFSSAVTARSN